MSEQHRQDKIEEKTLRISVTDTLTPDLPAAEGFDHAQIEIDSLRVVLIPREGFEGGMERDYLTLHNLLPGESYSAISSAGDGFMAVMAVPTPLVEWATRHFGDRVSYTSPLLRAAQDSPEGVFIVFGLGTAYITVRNKGLLYAEVFACDGVADALYHLDRLETAYGISRLTISVSGINASATATSMAKHYRKVRTVCE